MLNSRPLKICPQCEAEFLPKSPRGTFCSTSCSSKRNRSLNPRRLTGTFLDIEKRSEPALNGCLLWLGTKSRSGYGRIGIAGRNLVAHRVAYELVKGPIPAGLYLDHLCRNPSCVNPDHLEPVTPHENVRRGLRGVLLTHCGKGHEYNEANTIFRAGRRWCRPCRADFDARRHAATKAAKAARPTPDDMARAMRPMMVRK